MYAVLLLIVRLVTAPWGVAAGFVPRALRRLPLRDCGVARHASKALSLRLGALLSTLPGGSWSAASAVALLRYGPNPSMAMAVAGAGADPRRRRSPIAKT